MTEETIHYVYAPEEPLTPREERLARASQILRWGGIINGAAALLIALLGIIAGLTENPGLYETLADLFLGRLRVEADAAVIGIMLLLLANVSVLLGCMVGVLAQEFWSIVLLLGMIAGNIALIALVGFIPGILAILVGAYAGYVLISDPGAFKINPVALKELRERMRGSRAFVVMTIYLGLMSGFTILLYLIQRGVLQSDGSAVTGALGRTLFRGVVGIELLLILFIAPAFTSGAVSTERERKTYDLLQITLLPKPAFIIGKLESAMGYILLLLLAAIPLQSIAFLFGGVSEQELLIAFVVLAVTAIALGTVGLFFSTVVDRTLGASIRAYVVAFAVMVGIPLVFSYFIVGVYEDALSGTKTGVDSVVMETAFIYLGAFLVSLNPLTTAVASQQLLIDQKGLGFFEATLNNGDIIPLVSPWITFTILYLMISAILIALAVRRMRRVEA